MSGIVCVYFAWSAIQSASALEDSAVRAVDPQVYTSWTTFSTRDGLPHDKVLSISVHNDQVWVGTAAGLARRDGRGVWQSWTVREGLPFEVISAIAVDHRTQDVWLGSWGGGLIRFSGGRFYHYHQLNSGLAGNLVYALVLHDERVWAATNGGVSAFDPVGGTWDVHFERRADEPETAIIDLSSDGRGVYAAAWCGPLARYEPQDRGWSDLSAAADRPSEITTMALATSAESLWQATRAALWRRDNSGRWQQQRRFANHGTAGVVHDLAARGDAQAWLGSAAGLEVMTDWSSATWVRYRNDPARSCTVLELIQNEGIKEVRTPSSGIPNNHIRCLAFQDDAVWVGTDAGLAHGTRRAAWSSLPRSAPPATTVHAPDGASEAETNVPEFSDPPVGDMRAVRIGVLRPGNRLISIRGSNTPGVPRLGEMDRMAAVLAIEHANARGGYRGRVPYAMAAVSDGAFSGWGWTTPEDDIWALAQQHGALGFVGYLAPDTRVTSAVALRTELPMINFADTRPSTDELANPWIWRCPGDGPQRQRALLNCVIDQMKFTRLVMVRTPALEDQVHLDRWADHARARGCPLLAQLTFDPQNADVPALMREIGRHGAQAVLTWTAPEASAIILRGLREAEMSTLFIGGDRIVDEAFVRPAGDNHGAVMAVWPQEVRPNSPAALQFARQYVTRFRRSPAPHAYRLYEATNHLLRAIEVAGPNRAGIREVLSKISCAADSQAHAVRTPLKLGDVVLGRLEGRQWQRYTAADLASPSFTSN